MTQAAAGAGVLPVIAIDGPAASGKGTLARRLAAAYGLRHLDTGLLYRATGLEVLRRGGDPDDPAAAAAAVARIDAARLGDPRLRDDDVAQAASRVSALPEVRQALLAYQRAFAATPPGAVLDGRDIGTVICPAAPAKLFVTADLEARARRRWKELLAREGGSIYAAVLADLRQRDERDRRRSVAPLLPACDAFLLDTSAMTADEAYEVALGHVAGRIGPPRFDAPAQRLS